MLRRFLDLFRKKSGESADRSAPASEIDESKTNLVYQDSGDRKGGSDSERKLQAIRLPDLTGKRFLDLGCNAGFFCAYAADQGATDVLGVDSSDKVLDIARERHPELRFRGGGWDSYPDGQFDVVICLSAIHYAKNPVALTANISHSLDTNGLFVLEGGLFGATDGSWSDLRLPVWREVGDTCLHLTQGYCENHLFQAGAWDWEVIGPSISQGGDPLDRYVIHARKVGDQNITEVTDFRVCLVEYAKGLSLSSGLIAEAHPASAYVSKLDSDRPVESLTELLANVELAGLFVDDLLRAIGPKGGSLSVRASVPGSLLDAVVPVLAARGVGTQILDE